MSNESLLRTALGRIASLGDLYDARKDDFCGISIFKQNVPPDAITLLDSDFSDIQYVKKEDYSEKFSKLEVKAELQVSVLAGLFKLEGSGRYLNEKKKSARTVSCSLIFNIKTNEEQLNIFHEDLKPAYALDAIDTGLATHLVAGISWGANCVLNCRYENHDNKDVTEIEGSLSAVLKKATLQIEGKVEVEFNEKEIETMDSFEIRIFGDVLPSNQELPTTVVGAVELMRQLPKLISNTNSGKGKPLNYRLIPIALLQKYLNFEIMVDSTIKTLEEASLIRVVQLVDQMEIEQQKLHDLYNDALQFRFCVPSEEINNISDLKNNMAVQETLFRSKLATVLTEVRSGTSDVTDLENLMQEFQSSHLSPHNVSALLANWESITLKINFARSLVQKGAKYIGFKVSFDIELLNQDDKTVLALFFTQRSQQNDPTRWTKNRQLFFQELRKQTSNTTYFIVDCDIHPELMPNFTTSCIQVYKNGQVTTNNLLEEQEKFAGTPFVQYTENVEKVLNWPNKRVPLSIKCTGNQCDPGKNYLWNCIKCQQPLEYAFEPEMYVYCKCGRIAAMFLEFKCSDPNHGLNFEKHDKNFIIDLLGQLRPFKEMNILLLGETGVGKSTWINCLINYLSYDSLEAAEMGELYTIIPSYFTVTDENFESVIIQTGVQDKNEVLVKGQSATQSAQVYSFKIGETTVRLIDTPGIGDTRGISRDTQNFEHILGTLKNFNEIHGICILLKAGQSRLNATFEFYIEGLLTNLHRNACKNIVFCFTHTKGSGYQPGQTRVLLTKQLEKYPDLDLSQHTGYMYDSESYQYLAALKNNPPVKFQSRSAVKSSWNISTKSAIKMLKHFRKIEPQPTNNTISLHYSRQLVLFLSIPLVELIQTMQKTEDGLKKDLIQIKFAEMGVEELVKRMWVTTTEGETCQFPFKIENENCVALINEKIEQLKADQQRVRKISAKFACFLKNIAIAPYTDAVEKYLDVQIKIEEGKSNESEHDETLKNLRAIKKAYMEEKILLEKAMKNFGQEEISAVEIIELVKELKHFEFSSKAVTDTLDCVNRRWDKTYQEIVVDHSNFFDADFSLD